MDNKCSNCGRMLDLDDIPTVEYNDYGIPELICEECNSESRNGPEFDEWQ